jgi:osmoprotectant transport system permease protein
MNHLHEMVSYLRSGSSWTGSDGLLHNLRLHIEYCGIALAIALAIGLPLGLWLGHRRRGGALAINASNTLRAVPTLAVLVLLFVGLGDHRVEETIVALAAFAIAPIVTNAYVGVRDVDADVTEAARGMGLSGWEQLRSVELPLALPLIMAGIRIAVVQVIATATVAAYIGAGGLGEPIKAGLVQFDYGQTLGASALVCVLALTLDLSLGVLQRRLDPLRVKRRSQRVTETLAPQPT